MRSAAQQLIQILAPAGSALSRPSLRRLVRDMIDHEKNWSNYQIDVFFVDVQSIRKLKRKYFGLNRMTDVISLNYSTSPGFLQGEIYICLEVARKQAAEFGTSRQEELLRLTAHGLLHLFGHSDENEERRRAMHLRENRALLRLRKKTTKQNKASTKPRNIIRRTV